MHLEISSAKWQPYFFRSQDVNNSIMVSSDAGDGIYRLWGSIPCMSMPRLLKSPEHQQAWYWLFRTNNICCCSRVNFNYSRQAKSKIRLKNIIISFVVFKIIRHVKSYLMISRDFSELLDSVMVWTQLLSPLLSVPQSLQDTLMQYMLSSQFSMSKTLIP